MNSLKTLAVTSCLGLLAVASQPSAKADEWNKKTILTVNQPLALPNTVLQPGKYVMKLLDSQANRNIVQVFNDDESHLITTILAIPDYKLTPAGKTEFAFWETPAGQPPALKAWFYPGDNFGQEFAYPKEMAQQIANINNQPVQAMTNNDNNPREAEVQPVQPQTQTETQAQSNDSSSSASATTQTTPPPSNPPETAQVTPPPQPPAQPPTTMEQNNTQSNAQSETTAPAQNLPRTASPYPLIGLAGLLSLGVALVLRVARQGA